jgi:hypothetical protein
MLAQSARVSTMASAMTVSSTGRLDVTRSSVPEAGRSWNRGGNARESIRVPPLTTPAHSRTIARMRDITELKIGYPGILRQRGAPSEAQYAIIEGRIGCPLPVDYKAFLSAQNGGAPEINFLDTDDDAFQIECFNYLDEKKEDIYDVEKASARASRALGKEVVAIAPDGSGDQLVLRRVGGDWEVAWWRHDEGTCERVAASFSELLDRLTAPPDD